MKSASGTNPDHRFFLKKKAIGISISNSDNLQELGLGEAHLKDVMIESARYVLATGGNLIYGGDMRKGGFTHLMFDLLKYYKNEKDLPAERFINYLSWPLSLDLTEEIRLSVYHIVTFREIPPPGDVKIRDLNKAIEPDTPENLFIWARCLSYMRQEMEKACFARIFIGGKKLGYRSKCPGILEELFIAVNMKHPVYLVGGFGGAAGECVKALNKKKSVFFTNEYHCERNPLYSDFVNLYNSKMPDKIDYESYGSAIVRFGYIGLSKVNGLSVEENKRLAVTTHIQEIIYLIFKGLNEIAS